MLARFYHRFKRHFTPRPFSESNRVISALHSTIVLIIIPQQPIERASECHSRSIRRRMRRVYPLPINLPIYLSVLPCRLTVIFFLCNSNSIQLPQTHQLKDHRPEKNMSQFNSDVTHSNEAYDTKLVNPVEFRSLIFLRHFANHE